MSPDSLVQALRQLHDLEPEQLEKLLTALHRDTIPPPPPPANPQTILGGRQLGPRETILIGDVEGDIPPDLDEANQWNLSVDQEPDPEPDEPPSAIEEPLPEQRPEEFPRCLDESVPAPESKQPEPEFEQPEPKMQTPESAVGPVDWSALEPGPLSPIPKSAEAPRANRRRRELYLAGRVALAGFAFLAAFALVWVFRPSGQIPAVAKAAPKEKSDPKSTAGKAKAPPAEAKLKNADLRADNLGPPPPVDDPLPVEVKPGKNPPAKVGGLLPPGEPPPDKVTMEKIGYLRIKDATSAAFLNNQLLVTGTRDGKLNFWDVRSGDLKRTWQASSKPVTSLATNPDNHWLASASKDWSLTLFDTRISKDYSLAGHQDSVTKVTVSPDGRFVASASEDGTVRVWGTDSHKQLESWTFIQGESLFYTTINDLAFTPDSRVLLVAEGPRIYVIDLLSGRFARTIDARKGPVLSLAMRRDGKVLASAGRDGTVRFWDPLTGEEKGSLLDPKNEGVSSVAFSADGRSLFTGSWGGAVRVWNPATGTSETMPLAGSPGIVQKVVPSPDGRLLASVHSGGVAYLFQLNSPAPPSEPVDTPPPGRIGGD